MDKAVMYAARKGPRLSGARRPAAWLPRAWLTPPSSTASALWSRSTARPTSSPTSEPFNDFVKGVAAVVAKENPADVDALMGCHLGHRQRHRQRDRAGRSCSSPSARTCSIRRFARYRRRLLRPLCPHGRQDRRSRQPGRRGLLTPPRSARTSPCRSPR